MNSRPPVIKANALVGVLILAAIVVAAIAMLQMDPFGQSGNRDGQFSKLRKIDPALIHYEQTGEIRVSMEQLRAVAVGPPGTSSAGQIYVAGDQAVVVFDPDGTRLREIALGGQPKCLAIGGPEHAFPGRLYVGMTDHVEVLDDNGTSAGTWKTLGQKALLTSIAVADEDVFVADAGNRIVWRYDTDGTVKHRIGGRDPRRRIPGIVITNVSPYFDLALSRDGLLRVVNPRALRIEAYTFDGDLEFFWGKSSPTIDGFFGCCNPSHFTILPARVPSNDRFVTVEKGIPRVKVYDGQGKFECVVAGPEQLSVGPTDPPPDVAADGQGRILILDQRARCVRIFQRKQTENEATP